MIATPTFRGGRVRGVLARDRQRGRRTTRDDLCLQGTAARELLLRSREAGTICHRGTLLSDAYVCYELTSADSLGQIRLAGCRAHARRKVLKKPSEKEADERNSGEPSRKLTSCLNCNAYLLLSP